MNSTRVKPKNISQESWDSVESPELTSDFIRGMKPASEMHPEIVKKYRRARGSQIAPTKQQITLRLDREVVVHFQKEGPGWQTRINDALRSLTNKDNSLSSDQNFSGEDTSRVPDSFGNYPIIDIEGIGPKSAKLLKKAGISQTKHLLERGASKKGRKDLVKESGLNESDLLKWTNMADLMRIRGIGEEYSELLEAAGIDTVKELRDRKPESLRYAMITANEEKKLVRKMPGPKQVKSWVQHAKKLKSVLANDVPNSKMRNKAGFPS